MMLVPSLVRLIIKRVMNLRKSRKQQKKIKNEHYTFWDFVLDLLSWIPEIIIWPFRIAFRLIRHIIDGF